MATSGFITQFGQDLEQGRQKKEAQGRQDAVSLRERKADELETAIQAIQARTDMSPEEKHYELQQAHQQLTGLYQPHEGPDLFHRLAKIHTKPGADGSKSGTATIPGIKMGNVQLPDEQRPVQLKPGMTIDDILANNPTSPTAVKTIGQPERGEDGKWFILQSDAQGNIKKKELPGYSEQTHLQELISKGYSEEEAKKIMRIEGKLDAPATAKSKGFKYDAATDEVVNQDTGERTSREESKNGVGGETVARMFAGQEKVQKHKESVADKRFTQGLEKQTRAFDLALSRNDYVAARKEVNKAKSDYDSAIDRMTTMDKNLHSAMQGDQQAMLSLVANHIGMTLGTQKGARITQAVWNEAVESAPWMAALEAKFGPDGYLSGVTLTPDQMHQMVDLAHEKVDILQEHVTRVQDEYSDDLAARKPPKGGKASGAGATKLSADDQKLLDKLNGKK